MNKQEQIKLASELMGISVEEVEKQSGMIPEHEALYVAIPGKGGSALIVGKDGSVLYAGSSIGPSQHIQEFANGRRTPIEDFKK